MVGWNPKGSSPSKLANVLVKKIAMLTFLVANQSSTYKLSEHPYQDIVRFIYQFTKEVVGRPTMGVKLNNTA